MAIPSNTVWEVRPTAGSDNNGGGWVPGSSGTDWSQQNSPQYSLTGLASSGSGNTVLYASASADMVGNIAQCTGGTNFTTGFFEITNVSVGVSITFGTNNQGNPICSGAGSSGTINIGGALATIAILSRSLYGFTQAVNDNVLYVKASGSMTLTSPIQDYDVNFFTVIGYTSTRGDNGQATITTATNSEEIFQYNNGGFTSVFYNIIFSNTAGTPAACFDFSGNSVENMFFQNCTWTGFTYAIYANGQSLSHGRFISCEVTGCTAGGLDFQLAIDLAFDDCFIHANTGPGVSVNPNGNGTPSSVTFNRTIVYDNSTYGVISGPGASGDGGGGCALIFWNSAVVGNGSDGINNVGNASVGQILYLFNTIVSDNSGYGVNCSSAGSDNGAGPVQAGMNNAYYNNTSGALNNFPSLPGDVTLTASPFTDPSTGDFTLNSTSGGGPLCEAAGFPSALP